MIQVVGKQRFDTLVTGLAQLRQQIQRQLHVRSDDQLACAFVDIVFSNHFACNVFHRHFDMLDTIFFQLTNMTRGNTAAFLYVDRAVRFDIEGGGFATQTLRHQLHLQLVVANFEHHFFKEQIENLFSGVIQRAQNDTGRQFTTTVDTDEQVVFRVKLEIEP